MYFCGLFLIATMLCISGPSIGFVLGKSSCFDLVIPVQPTAFNRAIPPELNLTNLDSSTLNNIVESLPSTIIDADYNISARYCEPVANITKRQKTLQVLVHGATYTKNYWSGLAPPGTYPGQEQYSWVEFASTQGYPTLSVDRLCNGASSHPNSLTHCQLPLEAEITHEIIQLARGGNIPGVARSFNRIIYVGHSVGSLEGSILATQHPNDVDIYIMTGYSDLFTQGETTLLSLLVLPAQIIAPERFGSLDPGYLIATSRDGSEDSFYFGNFTQKMLDYDFSHRGTATIGELATLQLGQAPVSTYNGSLFLLNGEHDNCFCVTDPAFSAVDGGRDAACSHGFARSVRSQYPNLRIFGYHFTPETGHCLNNHLTAQESFGAAHNFLATQGI